MVGYAGITSTIAGCGTASLVDGVGTAACFKNPGGLLVDTNLKIYVSDSYNHVIRTIETTGRVNTRFPTVLFQFLFIL